MAHAAQIVRREPPGAAEVFRLLLPRVMHGRLPVTAGTSHRHTWDRRKCLSDRISQNRMFAWW
jgi:hypothetical protein